MGVFLALTLLALGANYVVSSDKVVVCYYGTWATYRWGLGKFDVEHINPELCSHLVYSFVGIDSAGTVISLDSYLDLPDNWGRNNFAKFNALKQKSPGLKTLLAVGGWNEGSYKYSMMAANPTLRRNFINTARDMVLTHGFDGFDVDWEYPGRRDTAYGSTDIQNFSQLLKELREEFDKHGLLITAAVSAVGETAALSYDIPAMSQSLDFIHLMTYDFYGAWDPVTGHNAPLHKGEGDSNTPRDELFTVDVAVEYWLTNGCPPEKLVVGVPFYGRSFTLVNENVNGVKAPSSGAGISGPFTVTPGSLGYNEFCDILRTQSWDVRYDSLAKVPYAVQGKNWVSYDDPASIAEKVKYSLDNKLGGIMLWSIESDDFHGLCNGEDFPLLRSINKALGRSGNSVTTKAPVATTEAPTTRPPAITAAPTTLTASTTTAVPSTTAPVTAAPTATSSTTEAPTTAAPTISEPTTAAPITDTTLTPSALCTSEGPVPNPADCGQFFICVRSSTGYNPVGLECPAGLHYNSITTGCDYPWNTNCPY